MVSEETTDSDVSSDTIVNDWYICCFWHHVNGMFFSDQCQKQQHKYLPIVAEEHIIYFQKK